VWSATKGRRTASSDHRTPCQPITKSIVEIESAEALTSNRQADEQRNRPGSPPERADLVVEALKARTPDNLPPELAEELLSQPVVAVVLGEPSRAAGALLEVARNDPLDAAQLIWMPLIDLIREQPAYLETLRLLNLEGVSPDRPEN
jgi:hypothetical protein